MSDRPLVGRAAGGDDGARERALGTELIARLHGVLRGLRLYAPGNQTLQGQLRDLFATASALLEDELTLVGMGEHFYVNGVRVRAEAARVAVFRALMGELELRGLGGLRLLAGLTPSELEAFLVRFLGVRDAAHGEKLPEEAVAHGITHVVPIRTRDIGVAAAADAAESAGAGERARAQAAHARAVDATRGLLQRTARDGRPALQQARRVVQPVVDLIMKNEYSIVGLTALKDHDEYTYAHCVNVSVLAIRMGQVLGFPRQALASAGVAALLHDMGKIAVPADILQKPGRLTPAEWEQIKRHPLEGVKMITRMPGLSGLMLDAMRVALQHHLNLDRSGYPAVPAGSKLATVSRLVAVADFFDAITSHRAYRARALTAFEALQMLIGSERPHFDPAVLWALVQTVGLYPAGTLMVTRSGYLVLALSPNADDLRRPQCRVLGRPDGTVPPEGTPELWEPMPAGEQVARVIPPEEMNVDGSLLLAA